MQRYAKAEGWPMQHVAASTPPQVAPIPSGGAPASIAISAPAPAPPGPAAIEKMVVKQTANVRASPDRTAALLKVVPTGATGSVFEKRGSWIKIGDTAAWDGHTSAYCSNLSGSSRVSRRGPPGCRFLDALLRRRLNRRPSLRRFRGRRVCRNLAGSPPGFLEAT